MALVIRDASNTPVRAIFVEIADLKRLFYRELRQDLSYATLKRLVLREALGVKLDARNFAHLVRRCDPNATGCISYGDFVRHVRAEEHIARGLPKPDKSPHIHPGFSRQRLRRELDAVVPREQVVEEAPPPTKRRGLLRHEITQLRGAGILLTEGQLQHTRRTVAMDSWLDPKDRQSPAQLASLTKC